MFKLTQVGAECLVGEETKISDKTTIKNCIIGSHCTIEEKVKLTNCIIMDRVVVRCHCYNPFFLRRRRQGQRRFHSW
jgi:NDP-sugar pyrophosphorylase family protein